MDRNEAESNERTSREMADFEGLLRQAMQRHEAPLGLKQRVLARSREMARERSLAQRSRVWMWQRVAASAVLAAALGGFVVYQQHEKRVEEQRKGEEAREQVMTAFRITSKTLGRVNERLVVNSR
jgi:anti-sigma-K factor RskA